MRNTMAFLLVFCALANLCGATVIYQDNFDGPSGTNLNGLAPDVAPAGVTWAAGIEFDADGKLTFDGTGLGATMRVPFVPQNGYLYTLSVTANATPSPLRGTTGYGDWIAMGFIQLPCNPELRFYDDPSNNGNNPVYWMMCRTDLAPAGGFDQTFTGLETGGAANSTGVGQENMKIVLNTAAATWTVDWYYNNVLSRSVNVNGAWKPYFQHIFISNARADGMIDNFLLTASPLAAWNPSPAHNAAGVSPEVVFQWNKAHDANDVPNAHVTGHTLRYLIYDNNSAPADPNFATPSAVTVFVSGTDIAQYPASGNLSVGYDKTVFWRVDEMLDAGGPIVGNTWKFATEISAPIIITEPKNTDVANGSTAQVSLEFKSLSPSTEQWHFVNKAGTDSLLTGAALTYDAETQTYTSTLSIASASAANEGYYYCILNNASLIEVTSKQASVKVNRLVAHYPFETSLSELVESGSGTAKNIDPNAPQAVSYSSGVIGQALTLDGTNYVELTPQAYPKAGIGNAMHSGTISFWTQLPAGSTAGSYLTGSNDGANTLNAISLGADSSFTTLLRQEGGTGIGITAKPATVPAFNIFGDGKWHLVTITYQVPGTMVMYVDGAAAGSATTTMAGNFADWQYPVLVGAGRSLADRKVLQGLLKGSIDDLQIYNYPLTAYEAADLYVQVNPGARFCLNPYAATYDLDKDCIISLSDFALLADNWLSCGRYPVCP